MISADKNMSYRQDDRTLPLSVVVLHVLELRVESLLPLIPKALEASRVLEGVTEPTFIRIDAGQDAPTGG